MSRTRIFYSYFSVFLRIYLNAPMCLDPKLFLIIRCDKMMSHMMSHVQVLVA